MPAPYPDDSSPVPASENGHSADDCSAQNSTNPLDETPDGRSESNAAATATGKLLDDIAMRRRDLLRRLSHY